MALGTKTFSNAITFTRASSATYFDSTGVLKLASSNVPRIDYNPVTLAIRGMLVEEQRTNLITYSEDFNDAVWNKSSTTITSNATTAPDGLVSADKLVEDTATAGHFVQRGLLTITNTTAYVGSIFLKAGERTKADVLVYRGATYGGINVDLTNGTFTAPQTATTTDLSSVSSVTAVGNGWYRVAIPFTSDGTQGTINARLSNGTTTTYTGDGTSGSFVWGAQLEAGAFPTSYIATTSAAATRSADDALSTAINPWFKATEGTLYAECIVDNSGLSSGYRYPGLASLDNNGPQNAIHLLLLINSSLGLKNFASEIYVNATALMSQINGTIVDGAVTKLAIAYKENDSNFAFQGVIGTNDTSVTIPTVSRFRIAENRIGTALNGWIRRIIYYPTRLTDAQLQALTA